MKEIRERERMLLMQKEAEDRGKATHGVYPAKDWSRLKKEEWIEVKRDRRLARKERELAGSLNCFLKSDRDPRSAG